MQAVVVPVIVPVRIHVWAWVSLRSIFLLPPFLLRIRLVGRRNVRFFLVHILHENLRGCRSFHVVCYRKNGNIARRVGATEYEGFYCPESGIRGSTGVAVRLRGGYRRTPPVVSRVVLVFPSFVRENAPSLCFHLFRRVSNDTRNKSANSGLAWGA